MARSEERLEPIRDEVSRAGGKALAIPVDAADPSSVARAFERVKSQLGDVNALVYNAGSFKMGSILEITPEDLTAHWKANCAGALYCTQQVAPAMIQKKAGTILLTGATAALRGGANFSCFAVPARMSFTLGTPATAA